MNCLLCKHPNTKKQLEIESHTLSICAKCELLYLNPYPHPEQVDRHSDDIGPSQQRQYEHHFYTQYFPLIAPYINNQSHILDIGCGTGTFLKLAAPLAKSAMGIEMNPQRHHIAKTRSGCPISQDSIETMTIKTQFDLILLSNVFSHLDLSKDPFKAIVNALAPKGHLIIITGEMSPQVNEKSIFHWGLPEHRQFLGLNSVDTLAQQLNLSIREHRQKPLADELFCKPYFLSPGRSKTRTLIKKLIAHTPFLLPLLKFGYTQLKGRHVFTGFICLEKESST